ncbi:uncharacterized protein [Palaemon carinicauda]|uniref:uncharacterized protein n=1 Tax=Palaemon carinicauda TaxID=392227 RepID=UPI0035B6768E
MSKDGNVTNVLLDCDFDHCTAYQRRRTFVFNYVAKETSLTFDPAVYNHHVRCRCEGCKEVSKHILAYCTNKRATKEETAPSAKKRKTKKLSSAPESAPPSPSETPRTESTDWSLSVPTTPQQSDCLQTLLQEATAIQENISATQPKKPLPKFRLSQANLELSYASVAAMAAKPGMTLTRHSTEVCNKGPQRRTTNHIQVPPIVPSHTMLGISAAQKRLNRIPAMKNTSSSNQNKPASSQPPKETKNSSSKKTKSATPSPASTPTTAPKKDQQRPATILTKVLSLSSTSTFQQLLQQFQSPTTEQR